MSHNFAPGVAAQPAPAAPDAAREAAAASDETAGQTPMHGPATSGTLDAPEKAETRHGHAGFWTLLVGSVGVVYGDIGTSPLYAFREALVPARTDGILLPEEVIGTVSLILWALFMIVT